MKKKIDLSVVVPCYNEGKNIPLIVKRFQNMLNDNVNTELILVDNGSTDSSSNVMQRLVRTISIIKLVKVKKNIGYGFGVWSGLLEANGEFICWTHADMQTDMKDTIKAFKIIKKQRNPKKCFIKGNRKRRPLFDSFFAFGMSVFETVMLKTILYDINAQPNLFHKDFLKLINRPPQDFSFDLYFYYVAKKKNYKIIRFPVLFPKRIYGESHWNTNLKTKMKFIKRTIVFTSKLKRQLRKK